MSEDLKKCPFCGNRPTYDQGTRDVWCPGHTDKLSVREWNTRHIQEGYALVPVEQAKNGERYAFIRGQFGYDRFGITLPCGVVTKDRREQEAVSADMMIDKAMIAAAQEGK